MRRVPWALAALPALWVARLLPTHGLGLGLRLAAATACLLVPGALLARALRIRGMAATLTWSLVALFAAMAVTFAVHGSLGLTLALLGGMAALALVPAVWRPREGTDRGWIVVLGLGVALGVALWHVAGPLSGDALFHVARVRKLDAFGSLTLRSVDEFRDGGLHPGYAFPLWHGFLALISRLAGVDPIAVVQHEPTVLTPVALLVGFEAGAAVFRSAWSGIAVTVAQTALFALASGHGGSFPGLDLPATTARQLLVPAALALFFVCVEAPGVATVASAAGAGLVLALVHPTYALFLCIPLGGYVVVRGAVARGEVRAGAFALGGLALPSAAVLAWLLPIVQETVSHDPTAAEQRRSLAKYAGQLDVTSLHRFHLAPEVIGRTGAIAVAGLVLVPLAACACRRRWSAFVLGGTLAVLLLVLLPQLFTRFSDAVSLSQARRLAGFVPFAFTLTGGAAVLARALRVLVLPLALGLGIAAQHYYPGAFGYVLRGGGPVWAVWVAVIGGAAALVAAVVLRRPAAFERHGLVAAAAVVLYVLPVAVHGFSSWSPRVIRGETLPPGLVRELRRVVPERSVVFSDLETSYRIAAYSPVYIAGAPPAHVADTRANHPYVRRRDAFLFKQNQSLAIPRRYGARWVVVDGHFWKFKLPLHRVYSDGRYVLYRLART
jgi:hypothetical protein